MYDELDIDTPTPASIQPPRRHKGLKIFGFIILLLITIAGIGYSVYAWQQNQSLQSSLDDKTSQIKSLDGKVGSLESAASAKPVAVTPTVKSGQTVIPIKELGISITVPDSLKDLTYSYSSSIVDKTLAKSVQFSTQTLTDKYASTSECSSFGMAPPLGGLEVKSGQHPAVFVSSQLVKQFDSYYVAYSGSQATCSSAQTAEPVEAKQFQAALSTVQPL